MSNQLELNKGDNFIFAVDVSASMQATDCPGGVSRIEYLKEKVIAFTGEASKWDDDGIDVLTFGHTINHFPNITAEAAKTTIAGLKANEGMTDTAAVIKKAYALHKAGNYPQTVLFVATDGEPADRAAVMNVIRDISNELLDEHAFAISFLTVGNVAPDLRAFLTALDDDLKGAKFDIVDVKTLEEVDFMSAFVGALHD